MEVGIFLFLFSRRRFFFLVSVLGEFREVKGSRLFYSISALVEG